MGKKSKYYCDFCDKMCPNSKFYKKSHALSLNHVYNRHKYYEQFLDKTKCVLTCPHAQKFGKCKYGSRCNHSYYALAKASSAYSEEYFVCKYTIVRRQMNGEQLKMSPDLAW
eukprot:TRINITY_DN91_c0_g1_i1.p3 TRINITY_DN91_c0_g1~~TRINITY_DN91_c0_g1_i1.p3  ORF type:complete len:112 (-),score=4.10 TRINITY_DN91_c0_g1_i1:274-609(-)